MDNRTNNSDSDQAEIIVGNVMGEAKTYEEFKGAGVYADLLLDRTFKKAFNPDTQNKVCLMALFYELSPIITVVIMEFNIFDDDRYIRRAKLREVNGSCISDTLCFAFVELLKFKKPLDELETVLDKGLYALKNMKNLTQMPKQYAKSAFELLFPVAEMAKLSKEEQKMIDEAQKAKWDAYAIEQFAIETGLQKGMEKGLKQGMEKGMQQGLQKGLEKGLEKAAREIAKKLKARNRPISEIVEDTGLSEEEIKAL